ncbi:signal peptidase I [Tabrizicola sp. BL-A-41-H6]|uniref:signal peptidase I n=1 Tax=Tabrizicola sp. BL-A-41-H6 TaxID=3421107 RepID=UPI003D67F0DE
MASAKKSDGGIVETIKTVFWALIIAGVFRTLFFQPFWIPSESMKDTLLIGDFLFVNKMAYGYSRYSCPFGLCPITGRILGSEPQRGDVVVFRHPVNGTDFIKRLIGLPGDTIQMKNGVLFINGVEAPQEPAGVFEEINEPQGPMRSRPRCENGAVGDGGICTRSRFIETLPEGQKHNILNIDTNGGGDNTDVFTVPAGHYFFMGDNRDNSMDSRFNQRAGGVGFVPAENLIGRADRVIFSSAGTRMLYFWTWRSDRFFKAIE